MIIAEAAQNRRAPTDLSFGDEPVDDWSKVKISAPRLDSGSELLGKFWQIIPSEAKLEHLQHAGNASTRLSIEHLIADSFLAHIKQHIRYSSLLCLYTVMAPNDAETRAFHYSVPNARASKAAFL